jgi:sarcosine oxidase subunit alpha
VDEQAEMGGWLLTERRSRIDGLSGMDWVGQRLAELASLPNVTVLPRTTAFALHDLNLVQAVELLQDHLPLTERNAALPRQRLHKIRAHQVILASGAIERPLVFGYNDVPGVMTAAAGHSYSTATAWPWAAKCWCKPRTMPLTKPRWTWRCPGSR